MTTKLFIDGEVGTTGLQIRARLDQRKDLDFISLGEEKRKDAGARREALNAADVVILCLPDDAAKEAVSLIDNKTTRVIDASTAHRVAPGWVYGFPEMSPEQGRAISGAARVTNPGCYPTGAIALVKPLVDAGLVPKGWPLTVNAVSGYSGGGKQMIAEFEDEDAPNYTFEAFRAYALGLAHKHVPEMQVNMGLDHPPLFAPAVGRYAQGMIVEVPLQLWALPGKPSVARVHEVLAAAYEGARFVSVVPLGESAAMTKLEPEGLNGTNELKLFAFGNETTGQVMLTALLDNLGKGASGQAVQCLNIMIGADEGLAVDL
ncbi:N-acetyl-gamma-glutamyl-phosphate reductase [Parvibaculum lavamentivorans DS-1]|uniref:N-acetyl-gamma-glutamyl-phosphate reductase n=1 Tax=Parvibaculum lavamentivorans (strain DS-1 / DSM 13023 / NCIMB 13966) TaxID=402881 RepID=A7HXB3_PARL1|nr:N-acetyl-gamma-glutamyl-phosphate reductase [Parvibaculum lavamentivorans]ABS64546.1 N-acetyl-gamma-glutamyl-phosphate reductase [Parvibaculum lavamentivorans DS-1]